MIRLQQAPEAFLAGERSTYDSLVRVVRTERVKNVVIDLIVDSSLSQTRNRD